MDTSECLLDFFVQLAKDTQKDLDSEPDERKREQLRAGIRDIEATIVTIRKDILTERIKAATEAGKNGRKKAKN